MLATHFWRARHSRAGLLHRLVVLPMLAALWLPGCGPLPPQTPPYYYVSLFRGYDQLGDGSYGRPWRTIQHGIDQLRSYPGPGIPHLAVETGNYPGVLTVRRSIFIEAVRTIFGTDQVTIQYPVGGLPADSRTPMLDIACTCEVKLVGLTFDGRHAASTGILVSGAEIQVSEVEVRDFLFAGIGIIRSPRFNVMHSKVLVGTPPASRQFADLGIYIDNSSGTIDRLTAGDFIDHIIDFVGPNSRIAVTNSRLTGSTIWYADGIRIRSAADVTIENNRIVRPPGAELPTGTYDESHGGIDLKIVGSFPNKLIRIGDNVIEGFDVGIGINISTGAIRLKAQGNSFSRNVKAGVHAWPCVGAHPCTPVVDFGGGPLGSTGANAFLGGQYAFIHEGSYVVHALGNDWGVRTLSDVRDRIQGNVYDSRPGGQVKYCRRWIPLFSPFGPGSTCQSL